MTDGITDLLLGILIMGIVIAVAFAFIIPLTNTDLLQFGSNYEDKAVTTNISTLSENLLIDKNAPLSYMKKYDSSESEGFAYIIEDTEDIYYHLERVYTFQELMLLLAIQDDTMTQPNTLNLRNMAGTVKQGGNEYPLYITDYGLKATYDSAKGRFVADNLAAPNEAPIWTFNKTNFSNVNLNTVTPGMGASQSERNVLVALQYYAKNHMTKVKEQADSGATVTKPKLTTEDYNIGEFEINGTFNGGNYITGDDTYNGFYNAGYFDVVTPHPNETINTTDRKYFIKYESQISRTQTGLSENAYKNSKYAKDGWYVEVVDFDENYNTYMFYNYMLNQLTNS